MVLFVWLIDEGVVVFCAIFLGKLCFKFPGPLKIVMHTIEILNVFSNSAFIDPVFFWIYPGPQDSTGISKG